MKCLNDEVRDRAGLSEGYFNSKDLKKEAYNFSLVFYIIMVVCIVVTFFNFVAGLLGVIFCSFMAILFIIVGIAHFNNMCYASLKYKLFEIEELVRRKK